MCTSGANSVGSKIRGKNARRISETRAMRPQRPHGTWQRMSVNSKRTKNTFFSIAEAWVMPAPSSTNPEEAETRNRLRSVYGHAEQKGELETHRRSQEHHNGGNGARGSADERRNTSVRARSSSLRDSANYSKTLLPSCHEVSSAKSTVTLVGGPVVVSPRLTKNGNQTLCRTENFVPLVVPGLSFYSSTSSSSTSHPQDLSISLDPAKSRCTEEVAGNCSDGIPEWLEDFAENLEIAEMPAAATISHDLDPERTLKVASRKHSI